MKVKINYILILIIIFGAALRLYNLDWGSPFYFHPDERNIAGSISRMYWEKNLNPQFFAYGSFWSYIALPAVARALAWFNYDPFIAAILILRVFSALQGIGLIVISYFIGKQIISRQSAVGSRQKNEKKDIILQTANCKLQTLLLPFLIATSPGLIQASHFGTFEQSLAFLYALIFYLALIFLATRKFIIWFLICVVFGISISIRVTSLILFPIFLFTLIISKKKSLISSTALISLFSFFLIPLGIFSISNPYSFNLSFISNFIRHFGGSNLLSPDFLSTMKYESEVALGTMQVFYTQQFNQTAPLVYQFFKVLPFVLNPVVWILFILSLITPLIIPLISFISHCSNNISAKIQAPSIPVILTLLFFGATFLSGSMLFVKWTRYVIPSLPFIYIFVWLFFNNITIKQYNHRILSLIFYLLTFTCIVFSLFFTSIYMNDTRIDAAKWAGENLKPNVRILSEIYDMGIVPFNEVFHYSQIRLFNFYEMDDVFNDAENLAELKNLIREFDVIVLPSRRVVDTRLRLPKLYPNANWFYKNLFAGNLGFKLVKTFSHPYDEIMPGTLPDESFTVFDHPSVMIFVKQ